MPTGSTETVDVAAILMMPTESTETVDVAAILRMPMESTETDAEYLLVPTKSIYIHSFGPP
jgi:hypothetical protein